MRYLQIRGREAEHYEEALDLINRAEGEPGPGRGWRRRDRRGPDRVVRDPGGGDGGLRRNGVRGDSPGRVPDGLHRRKCGRQRAAGDSGEDQPGVLPGQDRGDPGPVAGGDGEQSVDVLRLRALSGGAGLLEDVQAFIAKLNARSGGGRYRLPTEAEWEYAARAGTTADTYAGDVKEPLGNDPVVNGIAWYNKNSRYRAHPVGQKAPNGFGLYDMLGNVYEWVGDWYGTYPGGAVTDPAGPGSGSEWVYRGGSWATLPWGCRSASRDGGSPGDRIGDLGFRLLRTE